ncbi:von Willebrand factor type A domain protein, partial [Ancylostoma ceylanicum]
MTEEGVTQVLADIATVFADTKFAQDEGHHSRMGVVTYGEKAETRYNLTAFKSNADLMDAIWGIECSDEKYSNLMEGLTRTQEIMKHGRQGGVRNNVKSVIIIYASDFREGDVNDAVQLADQIKIGGTEIIVVAFDQGGKVNALEGLKKIASPGRLFRNTAENLVGLTQDALCQINCFCKKLWTQYADGTVKYGECLRIVITRKLSLNSPGGIDANWQSAKRACQKLIPGGHLATELDSYKHDFIA